MPAASLWGRFSQNLCAAADSKLESTVRYLGVEVDDALERAELTEV